MPVPIAVDPRIPGLLPACRPVAFVLEHRPRLLRGLAGVQHLADRQEALVGPAGELHRPAVAEQLDRRRRTPAVSAGSRPAEIRDAGRLQVQFHDLVPGRFREPGQNRCIPHRLESREPHASREPGRFPRRRTVDDRRLCGARVIGRKLERLCAAVLAVAERHGDAAGGQSAAPLQLADGVAGPLQRGKRPVLGARIRVGAVGCHEELRPGRGPLGETYAGLEPIAGRLPCRKTLQLADSLLCLRAMMRRGVGHGGQLGEFRPGSVGVPLPDMTLRDPQLGERLVRNGSVGGLDDLAVARPGRVEVLAGQARMGHFEPGVELHAKRHVLQTQQLLILPVRRGKLSRFAVPAGKAEPDRKFLLGGHVVEREDPLVHLGGKRQPGLAADHGEQGHEGHLTVALGHVGRLDHPAQLGRRFRQVHLLLANPAQPEPGEGRVVRRKPVGLEDFCIFVRGRGEVLLARKSGRGGKLLGRRVGEWGVEVGVADHLGRGQGALVQGHLIDVESHRAPAGVGEPDAEGPAFRRRRVGAGVWGRGHDEAVDVDPHLVPVPNRRQVMPNAVGDRRRLDPDRRGRLGPADFEAEGLFGILERQSPPVPEAASGGKERPARADRTPLNRTHAVDAEPRRDGHPAGGGVERLARQEAGIESHGLLLGPPPGDSLQSLLARLRIGKAIGKRGPRTCNVPDLSSRRADLFKGVVANQPGSLQHGLPVLEPVLVGTPRRSLGSPSRRWKAETGEARHDACDPNRSLGYSHGFVSFDDLGFRHGRGAHGKGAT